VLNIDLTRPDRELVHEISLRFSDFGIVKSVKIQRQPTPFALIEMATHFATLELAAQYGGSVFGTCALVHLEQEQVAGGADR
jgi:hypothetical protein